MGPISKNIPKNRSQKSCFQIYTDGSCLPNRQGAWAYVILRDGNILFEVAGFEKVTDALRMEIQAAAFALAELPARSTVTVFTDSLILVETMTRDIHKWRDAGWTRKSGRPILNPDLIHQLDAQSRRLKIAWRWVRAHAGLALNERCDQMCRDQLSTA